MYINIFYYANTYKYKREQIKNRILFERNQARAEIIKERRIMVLKYAKYTIWSHSSEHQDLEKLNEIFKTNITYDEVIEFNRTV